METRLDVTFTPDLSLQLYAQPFISSGAYSNFKEFDEPRHIHKTVYGAGKGTVVATGTGSSRTYTIDPDGAGPSSPFTLDKLATSHSLGARRASSLFLPIRHSFASSQERHG